MRIIVLVYFCIGLAVSANVRVEETLADIQHDLDMFVRGTATVHDDFNCYNTDGSLRSVRSVKQTCLNAHNRLRAHHNSPDLVWDNDLETASKAHAKWMAENQKLDHSSTSNGENIGFLSLSKPAVHGSSCIVKKWYNEHVNWDYANARNNDGGESRHFTQLVWASTTKVGCGMASALDTMGATRTYLCCQYSPKGNIKGNYAANVAEPDVIKLYTQGDLDDTGKCNFYTNCKAKLCSIMKNACCATCNS